MWWSGTQGDKKNDWSRWTLQGETSVCFGWYTSHLSNVQFSLSGFFFTRAWTWLLFDLHKISFTIPWHNKLQHLMYQLYEPAWGWLEIEGIQEGRDKSGQFCLTKCKLINTMTWLKVNLWWSLFNDEIAKIEYVAYDDDTSFLKEKENTGNDFSLKCEEDVVEKS